MHKLLIRQLKKSNIKRNEIDDQRWIKLLELVSSMYHDLDEEILAAQHTMKRLDEDMQQQTREYLAHLLTDMQVSRISPSE